MNFARIIIRDLGRNPRRTTMTITSIRVSLFVFASPKWKVLQRRRGWYSASEVLRSTKRPESAADRRQAGVAIQVFVRRSASAELQMTFGLDGDIPEIWFSSPGVPRIATQLWHHTCFEAFIAVEGQPTYHEFNFAPSGVQCWNCSAGCKGKRLGRCVRLQDLLVAGTLRIQQK